ncbi:MAG TPA: hypothetical protein VHS06_08370 [Chloroflexota bacterium]|nr:hypothetical protein [Chloroflexota bacterium]HEX2988168.1 hypothetical protein [Chloroflexota bacterium]
MAEDGSEALRSALKRFSPPSAPHIGGPDDRGIRELACRLDDRGCAYGRISNARLEDLSRGYERVEAKLNAVLLAAVGTFVSSLVGMAVYHLRGG